MDLTLKTVFKILWKSLFERAFSLLAGYCLDIGLCGLNIGQEFRTRLLHHSDINAGPCRICSGVHWDISWGFLTVDWYRKGLRLGCCGVPGYVITKVFVICLTINMHSLSKGFSKAPLDEHLSHVGAIQHDLPCKSVEWLLHSTDFCWEVLSKRQ